MTGESTYSSDLVMAMANSEDFTLDEVILVAVNCCERCMNVLAHEYGLDWGYAENSDDYNSTNTVCKFCEDDDVQFIGSNKQK